MRLSRSIRLAALAVALLLIPSASWARDELKNTDPEKYYILLDLVNQIVTVYQKDERGEYTVIVRRFLCTTGRTEADPEDPEDTGTPTPRGIWKIGGRERFGKFASFGGEYARYWTQIVGSVFFHSIMFGGRNVNSMKRGAFSNLGRNVSHGCVRLYVEDAKWLYYYACPGTTICVSTGEPSNSALRKRLKSGLSFSQYNVLQKTFADGEELPNRRAWVSVEGARLRKGSSKTFAGICVLPLGAELEVLMEGEAWVKVKYQRREGYVYRGYVSYHQDRPDTREDAAVMKGTAWLYREPSDSSLQLVKVPMDVSVQVLETREDGWTKIAYWNEEGYVKSGYLTTAWGYAWPEVSVPPAVTPAP